MRVAADFFSYLILKKNKKMANNYQHGGYARITQHDPDSSFNATYKPLWNRIMDDHPAFDNITLSDL